MRDFCTRLLPPVCIFLLLSCGEDINEETPREIPTEWIGKEEDFQKEFIVEPDDNLTILLHRESAVPFAGKLERNGSKLNTIQTFDGGRLNGKSIKKSKDGSWVEAHYLDGRLHGEMIFYGKNGKIRSSLLYEKGILTK